uniref:Uncharacterized protein n=1 Tax=Coccolithus braarudii TaxID=221442 RepID=A0A7S0KYE0_9EUKA
MRRISCFVAILVPASATYLDTVACTDIQTVSKAELLSGVPLAVMPVQAANLPAELNACTAQICARSATGPNAKADRQLLFSIIPHEDFDPTKWWCSSDLGEMQTFIGSHHGPIQAVAPPGRGGSLVEVTEMIERAHVESVCHVVTSDSLGPPVYTCHSELCDTCAAETHSVLFDATGRGGEIFSVLCHDHAGASDLWHQDDHCHPLRDGDLVWV